MVPVGGRIAFAPTRRLALVVAVLAPLWLLSALTAGRAAALVALALLAIAAVVDAALTPGAGDVEVERRAPPTTGLADPTAAAYVVRSRWPRALAALVADRLPDALTRDGPPLLPLTLAPGGEVVLAVTLVPRARGTHALGPVALLVDGPLGLVRRTLRWATEDAITVAPSTADVRRFRLLAAQHRLRDAGVRRLRRRGEGSTIATLREYAPGDDPRRVDWKASARRDAPVVREYQAEQGQTVVLVVDAGRLMTQLVDAQPPVDGRPGRSRFDAALDAALVLADVAARAGDRVGLLVFDDAVRAWVPPAAGAAAVARVRDALIPVQPVLLESDYAGAFRTLAERHRRRSLVVIFTDVIDARASRALTAHVARGAARHLPLVVAMRDAALDAAARGVGPNGTAEGAAGGTLAVYQRAAAEELLLAREEALARMRQAGVSVLDVPAGAMTAALVNRYLELKGRGAL